MLTYGDKMSAKIIVGDNLETLKRMPDCCVDSIVTDPPYGLSFMGKKWDYDVPSVDLWSECLRVLKPGGHLLAFAGTRTQHRMAVRIEDVGFDIRDMVAWVYGSGFPKSLDVSKAIDKVNGEVGRLHKFTAWMRTTGMTRKQINDATETFMGSHYLTSGSQPAIPTPELWSKLRPLCVDVPVWVDELVARIAAERETVGQKEGSLLAVAPGQDNDRSEITLDITAPATDAARQWQGWGTALKPALEPITVARKPLIGTVAENVLEHGTGALNIDGCRVTDGTETGGEKPLYEPKWENTHGRWPANLIHDGGEEIADAFGEASRFFYCPKASKSDRGADNVHPTVKPTDLMRYLCRLVTPPCGLVLDPFMGSGSTGKAATIEGFKFIGCELSQEYADIAMSRIDGAKAVSRDELCDHLRDPTKLV